METPAFVQVTGTYDPRPYQLKPDDQGPQYDNSLRSQGGVLPETSCAGYPMYLEYFGNGVFCLRCCKFAFSNYCNPSLDTRGCVAGIPGIYNQPGFTNTYTSVNDPLFGRDPNPPAVDFNNCNPYTDTCANSTRGFVCCQSQSLPKNTSSGYTYDNIKTTCQHNSWCIPGTALPLMNFVSVLL